MPSNCGAEKTLESPLYSKEIKPVHPKGNQSWIFIGRTDAEVELQYFAHLMWKADSLERLWCWERQKAGGEGDDRGWDGWMASPTQWTWVWVSSRRWWRTGKPGVWQSVGLQRFRLGNGTKTTTDPFFTSFPASWAYPSPTQSLPCLLTDFYETQVGSFPPTKPLWQLFMPSEEG